MNETPDEQFMLNCFVYEIKDKLMVDSLHSSWPVIKSQNDYWSDKHRHHMTKAEKQLATERTTIHSLTLEKRKVYCTKQYTSQWAYFCVTLFTPVPLKWYIRQDRTYKKFFSIHCQPWLKILDLFCALCGNRIEFCIICWHCCSSICVK